ncbi:triose-phosphate isomerase [Candidatus Woesearchaeota archaeon]|nr:triose-phosphate isomerase [Candidatus Woesearchaeota archaeon]
MTDMIIAANWKMNKTAKETYVFFKDFKRIMKEKEGSGAGERPIKKRREKKIIVFPPFTSLYAAQRAAAGTKIMIGAQDMHFQPKGAFTGEISAEMLAEFDAKFCLAGHSERRHILEEDNATINRKVAAALENRMMPVLCVGETLDEREKGMAKRVVGTQLREGLKGVDGKKVPKVILAYEPVWAIGTGKNATPEEANEMHNFIRNALLAAYGRQVSRMSIIIYGGSVNRDNCALLSAQREINGFLVGGASLDPEHFADIILNS